MRGVLVHGALALLTLALAFVAASQRDGSNVPAGDERGRARIVVADLSRGDLTQIRFDSEGRQVVIDLEGVDRPAWVTVTTTKQEARRQPTPVVRRPPDGGVDAGTAADGAPSDGGPSDGGPADGAPRASDPAPPSRGDRSPSEIRFLANDYLDTLLASFTPVRAVRSLPEVTEGRRGEFGLAPAKATLSLVSRQKRYVLRVGDRTFGGSGYYVLDEQTGTVHLFEAGPISAIKLAHSRLFQRALHRFEVTEIATAILSAPGGRRTLEHQNRQAADGGTWVDSADPDRQIEVLGSWMERVDRLRVLEYLPEQWSPPAPIPLLGLEYRDERGERLGAVELLRSGDDIYARTEVTVVWVRLLHTTAEQVEEGLREIIGAAE